MSKILLIDGNSIAYRAFYALPFLSHDNKPSGAIYGFANILIKILQSQKPDHVLVAFDHSRQTFRNEIFPEYKMQRKPSPPELLSQLPVIQEMLDKIGIKYIKSQGIEADDIIGTATKMFNGEKYILSGDRDLLQLIDDHTTVLLTKKGGSEIDTVDESRLNELFGLKPYQIIELKGLMGDTSDNIPGVKGVGEKTALSLLEKYQTIENIYQNIELVSGKLKEKLIENKDMAFISRQLATIKRDFDLNLSLEECRFSLPFNQDFYNFCQEWEFSSLTKNKDLFSEDIIVPVVEEAERITLTESLLDLMAATPLKTFCYDLKNIEFFFDGKIYYLERNFSLFEEPLTIEKVCKILKPIFENEKILKITKNAKEDMHILKKANVQLNNFFDLTLANYVVNTGSLARHIDFKLDQFLVIKSKLVSQLKELDLIDIYNNIEIPLVSVLFEMEENGLTFDEKVLNEIDILFNEKLKKTVSEIFFEAGEEFNLNSPKQVASILFDKLGIQTINNKKRSTSAEVLEDLRYIPIVEKILNYRKYSKLVSTYIEVYKNICKIQGNVVHTTFNQALTNTGRLSSTEPNLQNVPANDEEGKLLRKIFKSKFENGTIISADYNQIELRLLADMSGEESLINAYNNGEDIHALTASQIFGVQLDEVSPSQRKDAKAVNFGIIYGISDYGLAQNIKMPVSKARDYIEKYFTRYPKVKAFMEENVAKAKATGYAITKLGRIRRISEISSSKYITRTFGERVAMNMPLQGTASDIIKLAMIKVYNSFKERNLKSEIVLQVHDELIIDTYPGESNIVKEILKNDMENVIKLNIPLVVTIGEGNNLYECK